MTGAERPEPTQVLSRFARAALACLYQHRLLSTRQLQQMLTPKATGTAYARRELAALRNTGYLDRVSIGTARQHLWFLTSRGADLVETSTEVVPRPFRMTRDKAVGLLQEHTLAVAETGLAFLAAARRLGHQLTPLDWIPEIAHRLTDGRADRPENQLIVDALLNYTASAPDGTGSRQLRICLEVDRSSYSAARLADKLVAYARYYRYIPHPHQGADRPRERRPAWQNRYPRFPRVIIVLTGATSVAARTRRIHDLRAQAQARPILRNLAGELLIAATTLEQLQTDGPFAPIFTPILDRDPTALDLYLQTRQAA